LKTKTLLKTFNIETTKTISNLIQVNTYIISVRLLGGIMELMIDGIFFKTNRQASGIARTAIIEAIRFNPFSWTMPTPVSSIVQMPKRESLKDGTFHYSRDSKLPAKSS